MVTKPTRKPVQKKKATGLAMPKIVRENQPWGVMLHLKPFSDPRYANAEITAEIRPRPVKGADIKLWFSGIPYSQPLRPSDAVTWIEGLRAIVEESRKVAKSMSEKPPKKPLKKRPKR